MDTRQFMEEFVNRQIESSPEKAFLDPQTELITQMTRESDLEDRVLQVSQKPEEEDIPEEEPPQQFTETEAEQTPDAETADIETQEGDDAEPAAPPEEEGPLAEPSPPVDSASEVAVPAVPAASEIPPAAFILPQESSVDPAEAMPVAEEQTADLVLPDHLRTSRFVPDDLPFDFDQMLEIAQNQPGVPTIDSYQSRGGDPSLMEQLPPLPDMPDLTDVTTQPSTDFADSKIAALSKFWQQQERY